MALSLEQLRNQGLTNIRGRRLGIDHKEFLVGPKALRQAIEDITTTAATSAINYGVTRVLTSGSSQNGQYTLQSPTVGVRKTLVLNSSSTGTQQFTLTSAVCWTSSGSSAAAVISLRGNGAVVELVGVTTGIWAMTNYPSTAQALVLFSTST
jgi:hypothetical protein